MCDDICIAKKYIQKSHEAGNRGIPFNLSFTSFKNLMRAKRCYYTGVLLTQPRPSKNQLETDRTIDRIDSSKGYEKGNVVACCNAANQFKSKWENSSSLITIDIAERIIKKSKKTLKKIPKEERMTSPQDQEVADLHDQITRNVEKALRAQLEKMGVDVPPDPLDSPEFTSAMKGKLERHIYPDDPKTLAAYYYGGKLLLAVRIGEAGLWFEEPKLASNWPSVDDSPRGPGRDVVGGK